MFKLGVMEMKDNKLITLDTEYSEWICLMIEAKEIGLQPEEISEYLLAQKEMRAAR